MEIKDLILLNIYVPDCLDNYCLLINEIIIFNYLTDEETKAQMVSSPIYI